MAEVASDKSSAKAGTVLESRSAPEQSLSHLPQHRRCACRGLQQRALRSGEGKQRGHDPPSMFRTKSLVEISRQRPLAQKNSYAPLSQHTGTTRAQTGADWHTHRLTTGAA